MRLGLDLKTTKALIDALAVAQIDAIKRIAQTGIADEAGVPMTGRKAAEALAGKLDDWRKATS